jgi:hypothetical protein
MRKLLAAIFVAGALAVGAAPFVAAAEPCTEFTCNSFV